MGLLGSIFGGGGGGKSNAYQSPNLKEYETNYKTGLYNRLGAGMMKNPKYQAPGSQVKASGPMSATGGQSTIFNPYFQYNNPNQTKATPASNSNEPEYLPDFSNVGKQVGMNEANSPYDYSGVDQALAGYKGGSKYTPTKFSFGDPNMIDEQADLEYGMGAKGINRNAQGSLEKLRESVGTRRPGLLLKAGESSNRDAAENLANMHSQIRSNALGQKLQYGKEEQLANDDASRFADDQSLQYLNGLSSANLNKVSAQREITGDERDYEDRGLEYLFDLLNSMTGHQNNSENSKMADKTSRRGQTLQFLSGAAQSAAKGFGG